MLVLFCMLVTLLVLAAMRDMRTLCQPGKNKSSMCRTPGATFRSGKETEELYVVIQIVAESRELPNAVWLWSS
jgi:hypothetical protein